MGCPLPTVLPNNNASIQCVKLNDGSLAMVFNRARCGSIQRRESLYDEIDGDEGEKYSVDAASQVGLSSFTSAGHEDAPPPDARKLGALGLL